MKKSGLAFRAACLAAAAIPGCVVAPLVVAQTAPGTNWQLPAQDLATTLQSIARQSGREILFDDEAVRGRRAPAISGNLTPEQAVRAAIGGTGLVVEERAGALVVRGSPRADSDGRSEGEITVTGTRIRGADAPSPMLVVTRTALENAGVTDMAGFSRVLPQNYTGGQNPGVAGVSDQGGQSNVNNSTTLNLRGLGADATLTLINGHRLAYDALLQGIDVSAIPLVAIERVEVIADGASALYGSDAVAGVVNVLLRRDYDGAQISARLGTATDGGNTQQQYTLVSGSRWDTGGFMLAGDFSQNTPVLAGDRSYTRGLNAAQTLIAEGRQTSAVLAGHQKILPGVELELDAQFMDRWMVKTAAFTTADPQVRGQINRPSVRSWAVTPALKIALSPAWSLSLEATRSVSETLLRTRVFSNRVETPGRAVYENRLTNVEGSIEGPLFRLPGGDVRIAAGGGHRAFALDIDARQIVAGVPRVTRDATEKRESLFGYGELSVPLVGPANRMALIEALRLSAAVRYERYEGIDEVATPKVGLVYDPHRDARLKFSWGRSFKIPTLNQVNQLPSGGLLPASLFAPQPVPPLPSTASVLALSGGNPELRAERATAWSVTLELKPQFAPGLELQASWFDVDYRDRIAVPITDTLSVLSNPAFADFVVLNPTVPQVNAIVAALPQPLTNATPRPYDPAEVGAILDARLRNTARERARGLDLSAQYRIDLGSSRLLLSLSASYLDVTRQVREGLPALPRSGILFTPPHWRGRAGASWESDGVQLAAYLNYVGGVRDNRLVFLSDIDAFTTLDLSARVRTATESGPFRNLEFRFSALNQLDARPAIIGTSDPSAIPFDSTNQSPVGRVVSFSVTKSW